MSESQTPAGAAKNEDAVADGTVRHPALPPDPVYDAVQEAKDQAEEAAALALEVRSQRGRLGWRPVEAGGDGKAALQLIVRSVPLCTVEEAAHHLLAALSDPASHVYATLPGEPSPRAEKWAQFSVDARTASFIGPNGAPEHWISELRIVNLRPLRAWLSGKIPSAASPPEQRHEQSERSALAVERPEATATHPEPQWTDEAAAQWFKERVREWRRDLPPPTEPEDLAAAEAYFVKGNVIRKNFRKLRTDNTPPVWRRQGPRRPWGDL